MQTDLEVRYQAGSRATEEQPKYEPLELEQVCDS